MKLVTRAQLGWPASAAPTQTSTKGVKVHYEGTAVSTKLLADHAACIAEWKAIRASHLANTAEGYSDVAYNYAACPHGYLLEGRGIGKRTGANGNQTLNVAHYAIVGLVGSEGLTQPTDAMLGAIRDGIELLRKHGAGDEIKGHKDGYATSCPGGPLYAWVQKGAPRPASTTPTTPTPTVPQPAQETDMPSALNESNARDVELESGKWTPLAFADEGAFLAGPIAALNVNVHLYLDTATSADTKIQGQFYLTSADGSASSNYLAIDKRGGGGHQFNHSVPVPVGKQLWFQVRAITTDGKAVALLHRVASGTYWTAS